MPKITYGSISTDAQDGYRANYADSCEIWKQATMPITDSFTNQLDWLTNRGFPPHYAASCP